MHILGMVDAQTLRALVVETLEQMVSVRPTAANFIWAPAPGTRRQMMYGLLSVSTSDLCERSTGECTIAIRVISDRQDS